MTNLGFIALLCLVSLGGCQQKMTRDDGDPVAARPAGATSGAGAVFVSGRGGNVQPATGNETGVTSRPVRGRGEATADALLWEYASVSLTDLVGTLRGGDRLQILQNALNAYGAQGWELVTIAGDTYFFKRPSTNW